MNCLLIGGAPSVGKSESIYRLAVYLLNHGYTDITNTFPPEFRDFRSVLAGINQNGVQTRIIINSPTDTYAIIEDFKKFFDENGSYDILISSIRDDNFYPRPEFFKIMNLEAICNTFLEIPFAKITRRGDRFDRAINWYQKKMDDLIIYTLNNTPFVI
jgi:hypothetical protein